LPYPAGAQMATTGVAAEASSHSRSWTLVTRPGRVGAGVSLDSRIGNDGTAADIGSRGWTGMVDWLRIMAFPGQLRLADLVAHVREWTGRALQSALGLRTDERGYNQPTKHASP
jgi:hypothetical protein